MQTNEPVNENEIMPTLPLDWRILIILLAEMRSILILYLIYASLALLLLF